MSFNIVVPLDFKNFTPEGARLRHIQIAREGLKTYLSLSRDKPNYQIIVDNSPASTEMGVKPFGKITYLFLRMSQVGKLAIKTAIELSPIASGRYKRSWILIADGKFVGQSVLVGDIPDDAQELILVNNQPYARKIHMRGARLRKVPPGIVEKVRQIVRRRFGISFIIDLRFIGLPGAYTLKRDYIQKGRSKVHTKKGNELTYPALVIKQKF
jgi:hypothetical protein